MAALREIALTVEERDTNQFYWVLLEAVSTDETEAIHYRKIRSATLAQTTYSNALAVGYSALRRVAESGGFSETIL
ncbi:hypothetical protein [Variovorax sp. Sphag1AA]|uniref:hypothetical protein n=1 Tax=Variovorax sp. Sphag1AA TaxID=2587027 RepID=UPI001617C047|nr:hypothetical protein [Variovorax sp. Sphag1AA]MBB3176099.1 hypothetical protein [Variovorax sp. Sphag1AA]